MPNSWPRETVAELQAKGLLLVEDGNHGEYRPRTAEFGTGQWSFIRAADMDNGTVRFDSAARINNVAFKRIRKGIGKGGDVLFSHKGTVGKLAVVPLDAPPFVCSPQTTFWRTLDEARLSRHFLYYYMQSRAFTEQWMGRKGETDMADYVSLTAQRELFVSVPPPSEQKEIAETLGALDDKIEQNRRTGAKLEGLARAVFKAWFVDFEPVKAKAAGATAFPGMPCETFTALPTRFIDSEIGPAPEGWEVRSLYSVANFINGAAFKSNHFCDAASGIPVVKIAELKAGITGQTKYSNRTDLDPRYRIDTGEILYSWSGSPDTSLDTFIWTKGPGLLNQHIFRVVTESEAQKVFVYYLLKHLKQDLIEIARNKQTTGLGHVTVGDMQRLQITWPDPKTLNGFRHVIGPVFAIAFNGLIESEKLAALRDYLLPRLLSGRVRVAHAEREVADANA